MALEIKKLGVLLEPTELAFEHQSVLNPGIFQDGENIHVYYRAISEQGESAIGYARLNGPTTVVERWRKPIMDRYYDYESKGIEDPRVVQIDGVLYMTYVAHDGKNAISCLATSRDPRSFDKKGVISPRITYHDAAEYLHESRLKDSYSFFEAYYEEGAGKDVLLWHKDAVLFAGKIGDQFAMLHRVLPDVQVVFFDNFKDLNNEFWEKQLKNLADSVVLENKHWFETRCIGSGAPPIKTDAGWLMIYHAVEETNKKRVYHAGAALLDLNDPRKVIGKLHEPLFSPVEDWEQSGYVSNVVFPTGTAIFDEDLYIYYGAADKRIAVASVNLKDLLAELNHGHGHPNGTI